MKYDCYIDEEKDVAKIFERGEIEECGLMPTDRKPVFECKASEWAWSEWLEEHADWRDEDARRILRRRCSFPAYYVADIRNKAQRLFDEYRAQGERMGWGKLTIDTSWTTYTYRASANWKNEPTRYTFDQRLKWDNPPEDYYDFEALDVRDLYVRLVGMADAVHEFGFELVFDRDWKIYIMGASAEWRCSED